MYSLFPDFCLFFELQEYTNGLLTKAVMCDILSYHNVYVYVLGCRIILGFTPFWLYEHVIQIFSAEQIVVQQVFNNKINVLISSIKSHVWPIFKDKACA